MDVGDRFGPYLITGELGHGGMGTVFRARQVDLDRDVALKLILAPDDTSMRVRFLREVGLSVQFHHPNLVAVLDAGTTGDTPYVAMELLEGQTLSALIKNIKSSRFGWAEAVRLGAQAAHGLNYLHERDITHRDLKPANIIVLPDRTVKLIDFGLAYRRDSTQLTATNNWVGTLIYCAPEIFAGDRAGPPVDLWSLGCILYELLVGRHPISARSPDQWVSGILKENISPPADVVPGIPVKVSEFVMKMLDRDPTRRPDAAAVAHALTEWSLEKPGERPAGRGRIAVDNRRSTSAPERRSRSVPFSFVIIVMFLLSGSLVAILYRHSVPRSPHPSPRLSPASLPSPAGTLPDIFNNWRKVEPLLSQLVGHDSAGNAVRTARGRSELDLGSDPAPWILWIRLGQWLSKPAEIGAPSGSGPALTRQMNDVDDSLFRATLSQMDKHTDPNSVALLLLSIALENINGWPGDSRGWIVLGHLLEQSGRAESALLVNRIGVERLSHLDLGAANATLWRWVIAAMQRIPNYEFESGWLELINIQHDPGLGWSVLRGVLWAKQPELIERLLRARLHRSPNDPSALGCLCSVLLDRNGDPAEIEPMLRRALQLDAGDPLLRADRIRFAMEQGDLRAASAALPHDRAQSSFYATRFDYVIHQSESIQRTLAFNQDLVTWSSTQFILASLAADRGDIARVDALVNEYIAKPDNPGAPPLLQKVTPDPAVLFQLLGAGSRLPWLLSRAKDELSVDYGHTAAWQFAAGELTTPETIPFMESCLESAQRRDPSAAWPHTMRATWLSRRDRIEESIAELTVARNMSPSISVCHVEVLCRALWMEALGLMPSRSPALVALLSRIGENLMPRWGDQLALLKERQWDKAARQARTEFQRFAGRDITIDLFLLWAAAKDHFGQNWDDLMRHLAPSARYFGVGHWYEHLLEKAQRDGGIRALNVR